ncbi:MAG: hypothetical protein HYT48_02020 [Candidatus Vogelbacteria bacterium]|nr:hypothetical protein [Candidatus Vogelbacteria bacterium]
MRIEKELAQWLVKIAFPIYVRSFRAGDTVVYNRRVTDRIDAALTRSFGRFGSSFSVERELGKGPFEVLSARLKEPVTLNGDRFINDQALIVAPIHGRAICWPSSANPKQFSSLLFRHLSWWVAARRFLAQWWLESR